MNLVVRPPQARLIAFAPCFWGDQRRAGGSERCRSRWTLRESGARDRREQRGLTRLLAINHKALMRAVPRAELRRQITPCTACAPHLAPPRQTLVFPPHFYCGRRLIRAEYPQFASLAHLDESGASRLNPGNGLSLHRLSECQQSLVFGCRSV